MFNRFFQQSDIPTFACLKGEDVISSKVSDHHPVIHNGTLFWNIMMQGKARGANFNNGFGIIESDEQYMKRLIKVSYVIAEIAFRNPSLKIIGICEGPIQAAHVDTILKNLKAFPWMNRFLTQNKFHQPNLNNHPNWGLLMLADRHYKVDAIGVDVNVELDKLANRLQLWKLTSKDKSRYFALAHFPFSKDEFVAERTKLSPAANSYCELINTLFQRYANESFIFCADFNFNPYLINQYQDRALDRIPHHNSMLLTTQEASVTVDGVLLSQREKQKLHVSMPETGLIRTLVRDYSLFRFCVMDLDPVRKEADHDMGAKKLVA